MIERLFRLSGRRTTLLLLAVFVPLYLILLGAGGLWEIDEAIYAEISREMVERNDFVGTFFNYQPRFDKPPLYFWVTAVSFKLFGANEFSARLGSSICGLLGILLVYWFGNKIANKKAGLFAALILGTSFLYVIEARIGLIDTMLTLCIGLALYLYYRGYAEDRPALHAWAGIPLGLGVLAKGPVALLLAGGTVAVFSILAVWTGHVPWRRLLNKYLLAGALIALAIPSPWYWRMWSRFGTDFIQSHFGYHMFSRFATALESHGGPWYFYFFYVFMLILGFIPWSSYLPGMAADAIKHRREPGVLFLLSWFAVVFVFFTVAGTKLWGYILPAFPPVAILAGCWWERHAASSGKLSRGFWWGAGIQGLVALLFAGLILGFQDKLPSGYDRSSPIWFLLPGGLLVVVLGTVFTYLRTRNKGSILSLTYFGFYLLWGLFLAMIIPVTEEGKSYKHLAGELGGVLSPRDRIVAYIPGTVGAPFYVRRQVAFAHSKEAIGSELGKNDRVFAMINENTLEYLAEESIPHHVWAKHGSDYLVSNRPPSGE